MGIFLLFLRAAETAFLYAFLLLVLYLLWKFYSDGAAIPNPFAHKPELILKSDEGNEIEFSSAKYAAMDVIMVGRGEQNQLILPSSAVSLEHGKISYERNQWWVEDNHSRNGTYLNETKLTTKTAILDGDILRFGDQTFKTHIIERRTIWKK